MLAVRQDQKQSFIQRWQSPRRPRLETMPQEEKQSKHDPHRRVRQDAPQECLQISFLASIHAILSCDLEQLDICFADFSHNLHKMAGNDQTRRHELIQGLWEYYEQPEKQHVWSVNDLTAPEQTKVIKEIVEKPVEIVKEVIVEKEVIKEVPVEVERWNTEIVTEYVEVVVEKEVVREVPVEIVVEVEKLNARTPPRRIWQVNKPLRKPAPEVIILPPPQPKLELARANTDAHATVAVNKVMPDLLQAVGKATAEAVSTSGRNAGYVHEKCVESLIHSLAASIGKGASLFDLNDVPEHPQLLEMQTAIA